MTAFRMFRGVSLCLVLGWPPAAALAQSTIEPELSADELQQRFDAQLTRSLRIISPGGEEPPTTDQAATSEYVEFADEEQVNLRISFDFDSAALREDQEPRLQTLCDVMTASDVRLFRIIGHTDAVGPVAYNERLSELRAEEVKRHLVGNCGIAAERLQAIGEGERYLIDPGDPDSDSNRRVEFQAIS